MADKARTTFPIAVDFVEGELPSAAKMNGLARQARQGLGVIEHLVGDAWNQSGDSLFQGVTDAANMIPNLSRYLGAARLVNPRIPYLPNIAEYTHKFDVAAGDYEAQLPFPPAAGSTYSWSGGSTLNATPETNRGDVTAANEWWIDTDTGRILTFDAIQAAWKLTYKPVVDSDLGNDATWNIIPDLDTDASWAFRSVKIEYKNGSDDSEGYLVFLPPRGPLDERRIAQSPQDDVHVPAHSDNFQTSPSVGNRRFWQDDSVAADTGSDAEHYRYALPTLLTDNWAQAATIPSGFVYLWDPESTGTIVEGLIVSAEDAATPRKFVLRVSGANLTTWLSSSQGQSKYPTANLQATGDHSASMYPSGGLRLVTVGTSISAAFSAMIEHFLNHDHGAPSSLVNSPVKHSKLAETFDPSGFTPQLVPSALTSDDHPQYLHRGGAGIGRDKYLNGMLGDLLMNSTVSNSNYQNLSADSRRIIFGINTGPAIFFDFSQDALTIRNTTSGSSSVDLVMEAEGGQLGIRSSDTMSLTTKSAFNFGTPGDLRIDADDDLSLRGENRVFITSGTGVIQITPTTYVDINGDVNIDGQLQGPTTTRSFWVDMCNPAPQDNLGTSMWIPNISGGYWTHDNGSVSIAYMNVTTADWPEGCTLREVAYRCSLEADGGSTHIAGMYVYKKVRGYPPTLSNLGSASVNSEAGLTHKEVRLTGLSTLLTHETDILQIKIYHQQGVTKYMNLYPMLELTVSFQNLSKWVD